MSNFQVFPEMQDFEKKYRAKKPQVMWHWMSADLETPVSAYLKICRQDPYSFLLESVEGGAALGRYSIIGTRPDFLWRYSPSAGVETSDIKTGWKKQSVPALDSLNRIIEESSIDDVDAELPPMCAWGVFGYIGYDMVRLVEEIPDDNPNDLDVPDSVLMRPSLLVVFDNVLKKICIVTPVYEHADSCDLNLSVVYNDARARIQGAVNALYEPLDKTLITHESKCDPHAAAQSNTEKPHFINSVKKAIEYIRAGDIFQVVPSQRFSVDFDLPAFELYRSLRSVNPSPFMYHLDFDGFSLVGASPEILVRLRDNKVTIRPIAGTRKRGLTKKEDQFMMEDLLGDEKECAEHLMLLDLGRNDVGRVAEIGSVKVTEKFTIELYSHVMHIVSNVEGTLRSGVKTLEALFAGFPAGTVSGAPKVRAMEIIDELELSRRGTYAGGIGYFSRSSMDSCIALRTALVKDGKVYVQAGAGVVADSDPESEYQETCNKARAVLHAAQMTIEKYK